VPHQYRCRYIAADFISAGPQLDPPIFFSTKYLEQVDHDGVKFFVLKPTAADAKEQFINIDGLRGPLVPKERTPGTIRIAAVGGSFTFGAGLATQETLPYLLERRLDAASPCRVEVINFAVPVWAGRLSDLASGKGQPYHVDYLFFQVDPYWPACIPIWEKL
jgi:hypothetical protein